MLFAWGISLIVKKNDWSERCKGQKGYTERHIMIAFTFFVPYGSRDYIFQGCYNV